MSEIASIGVVGSGQMGAGIAHVAAVSGLRVVLSDVSLEVAEKAKAGIGRRLERSVSKGRMSAEDREAALARLEPAGSLEAMSDVDFIVEAVSENFGLKKAIFEQLDRIARPGAILASNTSSISITKIAAVTSRPELVIGMHFMNPVPVMKLIEIIKGIATSQETLDATLALGARLGKTCVEARDFSGFIINRILMPMINEAFYTLYEGIGTAEDIDAGMKLGTNQPMGPLTLADFIGLDTCLAIMEVLHDGLGDSKYRPCPLLRQYVEAGWYGRKSGRGVYDYREKA